MVNQILAWTLIGILALSSVVFNVAYSVDNNCLIRIVHIIELPKALRCIEDRLDALENAPASGADSTSAINLGSVGEGVFESEVGDQLRFKKLVNGTGITLSANGTRIMINSTGGSGESTVCSNIGTGKTIHVTGSNCNAKSLIGSSDISITNSSNTITVDFNGTLPVGDKQIGQMVGNVWLSNPKTNIGTTYVDIYTVAFDEENTMLIDFRNATYFKIIFSWDYVGTGTQQVRWVHVSLQTVLYEYVTFTSDKDGVESGWVPIPSSFLEGSVFAIEWQGKSTVGTDDPVAKGYKILVK